MRGLGVTPVGAGWAIPRGDSELKIRLFLRKEAVLEQERIYGYLDPLFVAALARRAPSRLAALVRRAPSRREHHISLDKSISSIDHSIIV